VVREEVESLPCARRPPVRHAARTPATRPEGHVNAREIGSQCPPSSAACYGESDPSSARRAWQTLVSPGSPRDDSSDLAGCRLSRGADARRAAAGRTGCQPSAVGLDLDEPPTLCDGGPSKMMLIACTDPFWIQSAPDRFPCHRALECRCRELCSTALASVAVGKLWATGICIERTRAAAPTSLQAHANMKHG
jgi:hypothetical protein